MFATTRFEPDPTRTDTGADFVGSILIDFDENGDSVAERRYKPYGELLAGTATPYGWTGNTGSRATLLQYSEQYNRRRHVSTKLKQWTTRDPLWPDQSAYGYVRGGPLTWADPSGLVSLNPWDHPAPPRFTEKSSCAERNQEVYRYCRACQMRPSWYCQTLCNQLKHAYRKRCPLLPWDPSNMRFGAVPGLPYDFDPKIDCVHENLYDGRKSFTSWGYGNWCGTKRGFVDGATDFASGYSVKTRNFAMPIDQLDGCCLIHDFELGKHLTGGRTGRAHCSLKECAEKVNCATSRFPGDCAKARADIIWWMGKLCERQWRRWKNP